MNALAVVLSAPEELALRRLDLTEPAGGDVVVKVAYSGISAGTERLLYTGRMPPFPGMGYPLVPGYESVGTVTAAAPNSGAREGDLVFVPGARCFGPVHGLFGGAAQTLVVPGARTIPIAASLAERGTLLALAATARHAIAGHALPDLIVGHGALGRLLARLTVHAGGAPTVWEQNPARVAGSSGYPVTDPMDDARRDYAAIYDCSGDANILDQLVTRLAPGGEITLAGFYAERLHFAFPPACMREARIRIAAQWQQPDLVHVATLAASGALSLEGIITHAEPAAAAPAAYRTAFNDPGCLKMILDWSACA